MNFTNENPCNFHYVLGDEDFQFDIENWTEKVLPVRNHKGSLVYQYQHDPNSKLYDIPIKMTIEELEKSRLTFEWFNTESFNDDGSPNEINIATLEQWVEERSQFSSPTAFREIEKIHSTGINRFAISHVGKLTEYKAYGHFHPCIKNKDGTNHRECHTVVVIIPINHKHPITEKLFFNHQDTLTNEEEHIVDLVRDIASPYETVRGNVLEVRMPSPGEYLVVEFQGSRCLHWLENYGTENEYICLIAEN